MKITADLIYKDASTRVTVEGDELTEIFEHFEIDLTKTIISRYSDIAEEIMCHYVANYSGLLDEGDTILDFQIWNTEVTQ